MQGRDPRWANRVFFARYDPRAAWLDDLEPAFGEREFFFEPYLRDLERRQIVAATERALPEPVRLAVDF